MIGRVVGLLMKAGIPIDGIILTIDSVAKSAGDERVNTRNYSLIALSAGFVLGGGLLFLVLFRPDILESLTKYSMRLRIFRYKIVALPVGIAMIIFGIYSSIICFSMSPAEVEQQVRASLEAMNQGIQRIEITLEKAGEGVNVPEYKEIVDTYTLKEFSRLIAESKRKSTKSTGKTPLIINLNVLTSSGETVGVRVRFYPTSEGGVRFSLKDSGIASQYIGGFSNYSLGELLARILNVNNLFKN